MSIKNKQEIGQEIGEKLFYDMMSLITEKLNPQTNGDMFDFMIYVMSIISIHSIFYVQCLSIKQSVPLSIDVISNMYLHNLSLNVSDNILRIKNENLNQ